MVINRIKKAKTRKFTHHQARKKKLIIDSVIELNMDEIMDGVRNTSSIIRCPTYLSRSRRMQRLQDLRHVGFAELSVSDIPKDLCFMFDYSKILDGDDVNQAILQLEDCKQKY